MSSELSLASLQVEGIKISLKTKKKGNLLGERDKLFFVTTGEV